MKEGDRIGFVAVNTENLASVVFACLALGLPINPIMNERDILYMFSMTKPKMIFCDAENVKIVQSAVDEMKSEAKVLTVMDKVDGFECATEILRDMEGITVDDVEFPITDASSTAAILCSSGSTGFPKGVDKSHKQIIANFVQSWQSPRQGKTVFLQGSPIFWLSGFYNLITTSLYRSVRICSAKPWDPQELVDVINKYKVSVYIVAPYVLVSLLKLENFKPLESLKTLFVVGSVISEKLCEKFRPYLPNGKLMIGYGSTEQDFLAVDYLNANNGSCGHAFYNVEFKVIDNNGNSLGPNQQGEIYSRLPVRFSGYIGQPEKTAEAFEGDWFKMGDIGYFDDNLNLHIIDRKKEMLKYNGFIVTPSELEKIVNEIKGVASSCVVGVFEPESGINIIHAFVILEEHSELTADYILDYVNSKVIDVKRIRGGVHIVDSFPLGMTGNVDRNKVKALVKNILSQG